MEAQEGQSDHAAEVARGPRLTRLGHSGNENSAVQRPLAYLRCAMVWASAGGVGSTPPRFRTIQV